MTIRIPIQFLAFMVYTVGVLVLAGVISYFVFEWRDDDGASVSVNGITLESLDERIDKLDGRISGVSSRVSSLDSKVGTVSFGSSDSRQCHQALSDLILAVAEALATQNIGPSLERNISQIETDFNLYC